MTRTKCQHLSEYAIMIGVVMSVVIVAQELVKRTLMAKVKDGSDSMVNYSQDVRSEFFPNEESNKTNNAQALPVGMWNTETLTDTVMGIQTNVNNDFSATYDTEITTQIVNRQAKE